MGLKSVILLPSPDPLFTQWLFAASIFVPKTEIRSGLLAIYCKAWKSVRIDKLFILIFNADDTPEMFPAASVAVAVSEWLPSLSVDDVIENAPLLSAVAEPKSVRPL